MLLRRKLTGLNELRVEIEQQHREHVAEIEERYRVRVEDVRAQEAATRDVLQTTRNQRTLMVELAGKFCEPEAAARERPKLGRPPKASGTEIRKASQRAVQGALAAGKGRRGRKAKAPRVDRSDPGGPPLRGVERDQPPDDDELTGRDDL